MLQIGPHSVSRGQILCYPCSWHLYVLGPKNVPHMYKYGREGHVAELKG